MDRFLQKGRVQGYLFPQVNLSKEHHRQGNLNGQVHKMSCSADVCKLLLFWSPLSLSKGLGGHYGLSNAGFHTTKQIRFKPLLRD